MELDGGCHCGAIAIRLRSARTPAALPVRECGCTFCRRHRPRYTSDPEGAVTITVRDPAALTRYRFGLRLADFLICRTCGVFVAAFEPGGDQDGGSRERAGGGEAGRAVINLATLARADDFTAAPVAFTAYDDEDAAARTARRARAWTPARLLVS